LHVREDGTVHAVEYRDRTRNLCPRPRCTFVSAYLIVPLSLQLPRIVTLVILAPGFLTLNSLPIATAGLSRLDTSHPRLAALRRVSRLFLISCRAEQSRADRGKMSIVVGTNERLLRQGNPSVRMHPYRSEDNTILGADTRSLLLMYDIIMQVHTHPFQSPSD